ncbi:hypothetical protein QWY28_13375 [Nocardioides sp. SOB77]|uniref:Helix-turn-helix domain-containing protein n=1 Tax=Nocardioides oceani TaxID=3058369 RepID=A0ABT8FGX8_9ACTN|nr:hypothetical protein [Nocardioides oceani]MDN4173946.1 hypothetical protein [Nocardioides oceani]
MTDQPWTTDATPAREHIARLQTAGWSLRSIAAHAGLSDTLILKIAGGNTRCLTAVRDRIEAIDPNTLPTTTYRGDDPLIPHTGTFRRIQALLVLGWSHRHLEDLTGIQTGALMAKARPRVRRSTHDAIANAYRQLATTPGPSATARRRALARGYASPAAWDDIDRDPNPQHGHDKRGRSKTDIDPVVVDRILSGVDTHATRAERIEVVRRWPTTGRPYADLERLTGWRVDRYLTPDHGQETAA